MPEIIGKGGVLIEGHVKAPILMTSQGFNGVAAFTKPGNFQPGGAAICNDWQHDWNGTDLAGKILAFPAEVGSTHAPLPYLDLIKNQVGPAAIIVARPDLLVAIGIFLSKDFYGPSIPLIEFPTEELMKVLKDGDTVEILEDGTIQKC